MRVRLSVGAAVITAALSVAHASGIQASASAAPPSHPLVNGIIPTTELIEPNEVETGEAFSMIEAAGVTDLRINVLWSTIAPAVRPAGFDARNPADPAYSWASLDQSVTRAVAAGFQPVLTLMQAPTWAQRGASGPFPQASSKPSPSDFGDFAAAIAKRYSGRYDGFPRVRYWEIWNEPNLSLFLVPQLVAGRPYAPVLYRKLVNAAAQELHAVRRDNVVIAGALAPFRDETPYVTKQDKDWGPLSFMRSFLCLSAKLKPICATRVHFNVWSQHPYTSGDPFHHAALPNDVSLGDLPKVRAVLAAAEHIHHIGSVGFWVTEFSYDTSPPDKGAVPMPLARRWTAEAMYRMWLNGVSEVTWFGLVDQPTWTGYYQSGLYFHGTAAKQRPGGFAGRDTPKPLREAFRFPFVAYPASGGTITFWGHVPLGKVATVAIQQRRGGTWVKIASVRSDRFGIVRGATRTASTGAVRAQLGTGEASAAFSIAAVPDHFYNPFGSTKLAAGP